VKVLFVYTNIGTGEAPHFVNGVAALSAYVKQEGHRTELLFLNEFPTKEQLQHRIDKTSPDLIGFSTGSNQWQYVQKLAQIIKSLYPSRGVQLNAPTAPTIICGGPHPTLAPEIVIAAPGIDMLCVGEGEGALLDVLQAMGTGSSFTEIPNLWVKQDGKIFRNEPRPLIQDLDTLPFPDREIFDYSYLLKRYPLTATLLMSGRGCPYRCPYCINHALARLYRGKGTYTRLRSPKRVCDEIEYLHRNWGVDDILIYDDTFNYDRKWALEFAREYQSRFQFPFSVNLRPEAVDDELLVSLRNAGLSRIIVGVEAGNAIIRREVLKRPVSDELLAWLFHRAHELGIRSWANTMMGIPGETAENLQETIDLIGRLAPDHAQVMVFYPYPGTDLGERCREQGYVTDKNVVTTFAGDSILKLPTVSHRQIKEAVHRFNWEALRGRVERQTKGDIDLCMWYLDEINPKTHRPLQAIEIDGDDRIGIPAHPPSELRFDFSAASGDRLGFAIALDPQVWDLVQGGVRFLVEMKQGKRSALLYEKVIDPRKNSNHRDWIDETVLHPEEGKCQLRFRTEMVGENPEYGWAYWGHPYIERAVK
jgi:radical SAM superfamily enzyme YgiQ (UPF0313 family)